MVPPYCFLCNKWLFNPEHGMEEGYEVTFADYVEPKDGEWIEEIQGVKWFCEAHFPFARALSHLTSKEALRQLEEQFGTFPNPPKVKEELSRWKKLGDALFNGPYDYTPCALCHKHDWQGIGPSFSGIIDFADSESLLFCSKHWTQADALSHLGAQEALRQLREEFGPFPDPPVWSPWDRFYIRTRRYNFVLPGKVQRLKLIREALFGKRPPDGIRCDLCYEEGIPEENYVLFADYTPPEDGKVPPYRYPGLKRFCNEHLPAARALSHLPAQKAIDQLRRRFGNFTRVVVPRTRR